jgi:hypothetical protein
MKKVGRGEMCNEDPFRVEVPAMIAEIIFSLLRYAKDEFLCAQTVDDVDHPASYGCVEILRVQDRYQVRHRQESL